jgi:hypothetical protein
MARKLVAPVTLVALVVTAALSSVAVAAPPAFDIRGTWDFTSHAGGNDYHAVLTYSTLDCTSGAFAGRGAGSPYTWPITGTLDATKFSSKDGPYDQLDYTSYSQGTATDASHMNGKFSDSFGRVQENTAWEAVRTSGPPAGGCSVAVPTPTPTPDPSGLRPSALQVQCNYVIATSTDTCTATVADAGAQPTTTPTGSVSFSAKQGVFSAGSTCTLTQTPSSPGIASCSVQYIPPTIGNTFPAVAVSYAGDAVHSGATAGTTFLVLGGPAEYETPKPFTVKVTDNVPVDGTQVTACGLVATTGKAPRKASVSQAKELRDLQALNRQLEGASPAEQITIERRMQSTLQRLTQLELRDQDAADRKAVDKLLKWINEPTFGVQKEKMCKSAPATGKLGELLSVRASAAKKRSRSATIGIVKRKSAKAGPLDLQLKLNGKVLKKIARSKKRLHIYIRVNMLLPSAVLKNGYPIATVRRVTLTNTGKLVP